MSKTKRIMIVFGFLAFVVICGYALYALFLKPADITISPPDDSLATSTGKFPVADKGLGIISSSTTNTGLPIDNTSTPIPTNDTTYISNKNDKIANGGITNVQTLNNIPSQGATLSGNGQDVQYYNKEDGKFYRIDQNGNITPLSDKTFFSVDKITWAPNKNKAVLEYPDKTKTVYDFATNKQTTLPSHWKDFNFSADSEQIVLKSMATDSDNRWLAVVNADGSGAKKIEPLGEQDDTVYPIFSPNKQVVALFSEGVDLDRQEVYFVGQNQENFKSTIVEGRGFQPQFSPKGDKLFYSVYSSDNNLKPTLWLVNSDGDTIGSERKKINLDTWASKCTFADDKTAYCAVPKELPDGAGLMPEIAKDTNDDLYKIDIYSGTKKLVAIPDGKFNISSIIVSKDSSNLFFTDQASQSIHKIKLK